MGRISRGRQAFSTTWCELQAFIGTIINFIIFF